MKTFMRLIVKLDSGRTIKSDPIEYLDYETEKEIISNFLAKPSTKILVIKHNNNKYVILSNKIECIGLEKTENNV